MLSYTRSPDFQHSAGRERGRKREIEKEVVSITLIPRDFAVLGYWFQAGLWSMLNDHHQLRFYIENCACLFIDQLVVRFTSPFSREFQTNENWKSLESEIGAMISFEGKKELIGWVLRIELSKEVILFLRIIRICGIFISWCNKYSHFVNFVFCMVVLNVSFH